MMDHHCVEECKNQAGFLAGGEGFDLGISWKVGDAAGDGCGQRLANLSIRIVLSPLAGFGIARGVTQADAAALCPTVWVDTLPPLWLY